jgi:hypothetical protein
MHVTHVMSSPYKALQLANYSVVLTRPEPLQMMIVSGLFHWLASQSLFKVQISITSSVTRLGVDEISTCG